MCGVKFFMKLRDDKDCRVEIRISSQDKKLLQYSAAQLNMSLSVYLQMHIDKALQPVKLLLQEGALTYADIETFFDYQLQFRKFFKS